MTGDDFPNPNYDFQASLVTWARYFIYPDHMTIIWYSHDIPMVFPGYIIHSC